MLLAFQRSWKSIVEPVTNSEISNFVILTGPNGSGKSQLLNAIEAAAMKCDNYPSTQGDGQVRVFRLSELMAQVEPPQALTNHKERWAGPAQYILNAIKSAEQRGFSRADPISFEQSILDEIRSSMMLSEGALARLNEAWDKPLFDYKLEDLKAALPLQYERIDPFQLSIGQVFGTYFTRRRDNAFERFLEDQGEPHGEYLSNERFLERYGPPPWQTLNEALRVIGLDYTFAEPKGTSDTVPYLPELRHQQADVPLQVEDLSTGERTLLAVALSLYTAGSSDSSYLQLPNVLLLDEPDASLHPSMVQSLLRVLSDVLVGKHDVRVIMTTHSPTTVALAPESSLYGMQRTGPERLRKLTSDEALSALAVGIPTLSVKIDSRRTVVVEEKADVACYEQFYQLLKTSLSSEFSLQFLASGAGSSSPEASGSAQEVRRLVRALRDSGNDRVFGIVDFDNKNMESEFIKVNNERYTIENFALDPLLVATLLVREAIIAPEIIGLPSGIRHYQLEQTHADQMVSFVAGRLGFDKANSTLTSYSGNFAVSIPSDFLTTSGHVLESLYLQAFPPLKGMRGGLLRTVLVLAAGDRPEFIPKSVLELLRRLTNSTV